MIFSINTIIFSFLFLSSLQGAENWIDFLDNGEYTSAEYYSADIKIGSDDSAYSVFVINNGSPDYKNNIGLMDYHLTKYNSGGEQLWHHFIGTCCYDDLSGMALDEQDNIYLCGDTEQALDGSFDSEDDYIYGDKRHDAHIIKLDSEGNELWNQYTGEEGYWHRCRSIALDEHSIYSYGIADIDSDSDCTRSFVAKYNLDGEQLWYKTVDDSCQYREKRNLTIDKQGDILLAFNGQIMKLDSNGNEIYRKEETALNGIEVSGLAVDQEGNFYVAAHQYNTTSDNQETIIKYDPNGNKLWKSSFNGEGFYAISDIIFDNSDNPLITRTATCTVDEQVVLQESDKTTYSCLSLFTLNKENGETLSTRFLGWDNSNSSTYASDGAGPILQPSHLIFYRDGHLFMNEDSNGAIYFGGNQLDVRNSKEYGMHRPFMAKLSQENASIQTMMIRKGWNLLSLPIKGALVTSGQPSEEDTTLSELDENAITYVYNNGKWSRNPTQIEQGAGFWLYTEIDEKLIALTGESYFPDTSQIGSGWNLLGSGRYLEDEFQETKKIWIYDNDQVQQWIEDNASYFRPGLGVWVKQ